MDTISSNDFERRLGLYETRALTEPVRVTFDSHEPLVLLSESEFRRLKGLDRVAMAVGSLTDEELAEIARARVPAEYDHLDDELR